MTVCLEIYRIRIGLFCSTKVKLDVKSSESGSLKLKTFAMIFLLLMSNSFSNFVTYDKSEAATVKIHSSNVMVAVKSVYEAYEVDTGFFPCF